MQNPSHTPIQHKAQPQIQTSRVVRRLLTVRNKGIRVLLASVILLVLCALVVQPLPTYAADYTASTFAELETAITNANSTSSDDTITLSADITLTSALPAIANNGSLTIEGAGHTIDGAGANRIFSIDSNANVIIKQIMLLNGYHSFTGGAIYKDSGSSLTIVNSSFMGNSTVALGGAIYSNGGPLTIVNSIFSGNTVTGEVIVSGAAIASYGDTTLTIVNSTFNGNSAGENSGIIENSGAAMHLYNTIVVGTTSGVNCGGDSPDTNITNWFDDTSCDGTNSGDPLFEDADGADNILGTADDDLRLQAGSAAIDMGDNSSLPADTADLDGDGDTSETLPLDLDDSARVFNSTVDAGAYESIVYTNMLPQFTSVPSAVGTAGNVYTYAVTTSDADGDTLTITAPTLPAWLSLSDNGDGTATLSGTPAVGDVGSHSVVLHVSDTTYTTQQTFSIAVADAATATTSAPIFTSVRPLSGRWGTPTPTQLPPATPTGTP